MIALRSAPAMAARPSTGAATASLPSPAPLPGRRPGSGAAAVVVGTVGTGLLLFAATAQPLAALLPAVIVGFVYAFARLPLRTTLFGVIALAVLADLSPSRVPGGAAWTSPTVGLQYALTENLNKLTGVEAFKVSGAELLILLLIALAALRELAGDRTDAARRIPAPRPLVLVLALGLLGVLWLEVWGVARGGDFRQSLWQFRLLLAMPLMALLGTAAIRGARDAVVFACVLTGVSAVKIAIGTYYYLFVARPAGFIPPTATSHSDTVLFVVTMSVWAAAAYHRPTLWRLVGATGVVVWTFVGLIVNNRRTAYVTLAAEVVLFFALLPARTKRRLVRFGLYVLPVLVVYLAAGRNRTSGVFAPAGMIMSVATQEDASSKTRDIENYNLIQTLKRSPVVGSGWGHEYVELVHAFDISEFFAQYRYIAHNSVLWVWSVGGYVGFTLLFLPIAAGSFFAFRAHAFARTPVERSVAYGALATYVAFLIQAWSDMGTQSWTTQGMLAIALAASGKIAVGNGAWPQRTRLFGTTPPHAGAR